MMQKMLSASCLAVFLSGAAFGTVYEVNVPAGNVQTNFTAAQKTAIAALGAADEVQKTGGGRLVVNSTTDIASFKGTIRISDGVYEAGSAGNNISGVFGTKDGPTIVESGATLRFSAWISFKNGGNEEFIIAGTGYGNEGGAIVAAASYNANLGRITLAADATVVNPNSQRLNITDRLVDMNGHTFTLVGLCNFQPSEIADPGHIIFDGGGVDCNVDPPQGGDYSGGPENTITYTNGAYALCQAFPHTNKVYWTLRMADTRSSGGALNYIYSGNSTPVTDFNWYGPVELAGSKATLWSNIKSLHFYGPIIGGADIGISSGNGGYVFFHGTNTYTGNLNANSGRLVSMSEESLPGWETEGRITTLAKSATSCALYFASTNASSSYGWLPERIGLALRKFHKWGQYNMGLYADEGEETVCVLPEFEPDDLDYNAEYFFALGNGRKVLKGNFIDGFRLYRLAANGLVISAKDPATANHRLGNFYTYLNSSTTFENMGYTLIGGYPYIGYHMNNYSTCTVGTNTVFGSTYYDPTTGKLLSKGLYVSSGANRHAAAWILPGAVLSNGVWVGAANVYTNSCGMLVQKGGLVRSEVNPCSFGEARWGMGYFEFAGGRFSSTQKVWLGVYEGSSGHMFQRGGEFEMLADTFQIGGQGTGMVHIAGGTFKSAVAAYAPKCTNNGDRSDGCGRISVANGARPCFAAGVLLADRVNSLGMVELTGGGVMEAKSVTKREKTSQGSASTGNAKAYVNFNGGGVCAISNNVELLGTGNSAVDRATVYAAGAILEAVEGISANVSVPLQAPSGGGIASLALPAEPFDAYHCAPLVFIYGDGEGAAAVVEYDSDNDVITNIVVTSPGWGYTAENTTAVLHWCGNVHRPDVPLTVTVAANAATGGVTKRGPGRIALTAANTYGGGTVVEQGTLAATVADAIPSGSAVTVKAGATLELGSGVGYPADLTADLASAVPGRKYALISCPNGFPEGAPAFKGLEGSWMVRQHGTVWSAAYERGSVFLVR